MAGAVRISRTGLIALAAGVMVAALLATVLVTSPLAAPAGAAQSCHVWAGEGRLQDAVRAHPCVQVAPGVWTLDTFLLLPAGHTLQGDPSVPRDQVVLRAGAGWVNTVGDGVVNDDGTGGDVAVVRRLTLDANNRATGGVGARRILVDDVVVQNGRCWGVGIAGEGVVVQNSLIRWNGSSPTCPGAPGAGVWVVTQQAPRPASYAPVIVNNVISNNTGPGLDIAGVWRGLLAGNTIRSNSSWAGVSLFGSHWRISNNEIRHPATNEAQPYVRPCQGGPAGPRSAAIMVCQTTDAHNDVSVGNFISGNAVSSWYGILLIGNDEVKPYWAPRNNTVVRNDAFGSFHAFADDFRPGQWFEDRNLWTGRPTYF